MLTLNYANLEIMSNGREASTQSLNKNTCLFKIKILIVDDDSTSLAIVSSMLKSCSLQDREIGLSVVSIKDSLDALATLRSANGEFDLLITDLHMPGMNGLELQKHVKQEFNIPVIIMSADDKESAILKSIESGAAFYIVKPVNQDDLRNIWQYAMASKKGKEVVVCENAQKETSSNEKLIVCEEPAFSSSAANEEGSQKKRRGRKREREEEQQEEDGPAPAKKAKVVWTNTLHNRFLQAVSHIGLEKAVPKKILEFMNVSGLTRENVASHLQKYRMFLKKVAEKGFSTSRNLSEKVLRSTFAYGHATSMLENSRLEHSSILRQQPFRRSSSQPGYGGSVHGLGSSSFGLSRFYNNQEASSSNCVPQLHYGQSSLFCNQASTRQPMFGSPYPLHQANLLTFNNTGINLSSNAATSYGLTSATNPMQMNPQQNQSNLQNHVSLSKFSLFGFGCSSYSSGTCSMRTINGSYPRLNQNSTYAGIRLTSDGELIGNGQKRFNGNELLSACNNSGNGLVNWNRNNNQNNAPPRNGEFGFSGGQVTGFSSTGFGSESQCSPTFSPANPENTSVVTPLSQQNFITGLGNALGENDINALNNLMNNASNLSSISDNNQHEIGEDGLGELLFGTSCTNPCQEERNAEEYLNVNLLSSQYHAEVSYPVNELLNKEFSSSCTIADTTSWTEQQSSVQPQPMEETVNPNNVGNVNPADVYYPGFEQPQSNNAKAVNNSELNGMHLDEAPISGNEGWGEDFLNFLLGNDPY